MTWAPHLFEKAAGKAGFNNTSIESAIKEYERLLHNKLPPILTLGHLAYYTQTNYWYLNRLVSRKQHDAYRTFRIRKRSGGYRNISVPEKDLKKVLKWIDEKILSNLNAGEYSFAFEKGKKILDCATRHAGCKWLIKIDIRNFFESITEKQVYNVFSNYGYNNLVSFELARICTKILDNAKKYDKCHWKNVKKNKYYIKPYYNPKLGHLPQGSPASPKISNLVARKMDMAIAQLSKADNFIYTRYADDIVLSTSMEYDRKKAEIVLNKVTNIMETNGFRSNINKIKIINPGLNKIVLGLNITEDGVHLLKRIKRKMECHIHYCIKEGPVKHAEYRGFKTVIGLKNYLKGMMAYINDVDKCFFNKIKKQFDQIEWPI